MNKRSFFQFFVVDHSYRRSRVIMCVSPTTHAQSLSELEILYTPADPFPPLEVHSLLLTLLSRLLLAQSVTDCWRSVTRGLTVSDWTH